MEVTAQILDALAFVLVTPEFLGEQTLCSIRHFLDTISQRIRHAIFRKRFMILVAVFLFIIPFLITSGILLLVVSKNIVGGTHIFTQEQPDVAALARAALDFIIPSGIVIAVILSPIVLIAVLLIIILNLVVFIAARLVVRRIMFGLGVVFFFLARGISVWHAW